MMSSRVGNRQQNIENTNAARIININTSNPAPKITMIIPKSNGNDAKNGNTKTMIIHNGDIASLIVFFSGSLELIHFLIEYDHHALNDPS